MHRVYFDSCCFIELAKGKFGKALLDGGKHIWYLETLLRASRAGKIQVVTSTLTVVECVGAGDDTSADVQHLFMGLLTSGKGGVFLLDPDLWVVERARDLRWKDGLNFKCPDSVHVATALENGCDELLTMDGVGASAKSILKRASELQALGLRAVVPSETLLIPDEFKQHDWVNEDDKKEEA